MRWKNNYVLKRVPELIRKYSKDSNLTLAAIPPIPYIPTRQASKKEFRKNFGHLEKMLALAPDSIISDNFKIDSIYININKINYIIKQKLQSKGKVLLNQ